mmetsp:Transcript_117728/g.375258  ORF Transcript_117728/g.375258 Transcript_117728/m.375258 type:complete len:230 (-) Transcript_117728:916-1605(-)
MQVWARGRSAWRRLRREGRAHIVPLGHHGLSGVAVVLQNVPQVCNGQLLVSHAALGPAQGGAGCGHLLSDLREVLLEFGHLLVVLGLGHGRGLSCAGAVLPNLPELALGDLRLRAGTSSLVLSQGHNSLGADELLLHLAEVSLRGRGPHQRLRGLGTETISLPLRGARLRDLCTQRGLGLRPSFLGSLRSGPSCFSIFGLVLHSQLRLLQLPPHGGHRGPHLLQQNIRP